MKTFLDYLKETEERNPYLAENSSAGATCAANVATAVDSSPKAGAIGVGFNPDADWGIYDEAKPKRKRAQKSPSGPSVIRR